MEKMDAKAGERTEAHKCVPGIVLPPRGANFPVVSDGTLVGSFGF